MIGMAYDMWMMTQRSMEEYSFEYRRQHYGKKQTPEVGPLLVSAPDLTSEALSTLIR